MKKTNASSTGEGGRKPGELTLLNVYAKDRQTINIAPFYLEKCRRLLAPLAEMIREGELTCSPSSAPPLRSGFQDMKQKSTFQRMKVYQLADMYDSFAATMDNIIAICRADRRYEEAWKRLISNFEVSSVDLRRELGREVILEKNYGWITEIAPEALFAPALVTEAREKYNGFTGNYELYGNLCLRASDRQILSDHFFGKEYANPQLTPQLPKETHLEIENFEMATATDLMTLEGIALNGSMLGANGAVSGGQLKKVKTQTQIQGFGNSMGKWPLDRVEMLCLTYFTLLANKGKKDPIDIKRIAKFAVEDMARYIVGPIFTTFMPAWQSFTKSWTQEAFTMEVAKAVGAVLMSAANEWMNLDNFKMQLLCKELANKKNNRYLKLFPYKDRSKSSALRKIDKEHEADRKWVVEPIEWFEEMGFKFAVHWIMYLCAIGIVEVAMDTDITDISEDPMEGMRYVRMTQLGKYAFGIEKDYHQKVAGEDAGVEFDPQNGIITVDAKSPFQMFLSNVAKRISPTRFRISTESLISGCRRETDLNQRITNLQTIIDPDKEPAIKKIIDEAQRRTDCAQLDEGYSMMRLRPDLPGLREAILSNKELREMTILAGPTLALVKTQRLERFYALCAAYGYLME